MTKENYVDKKQLYDSLCEWKQRGDLAEEQGLERPKLPDDVGLAIMQIAEGMANRPNFRNYTWKEEMIGDGIVAAVKAMNKFDPFRKGKNGEVNPFGFISLCVWRAFLNRIKSEKNINKAKVDSMFDPSTETFSTIDGHDDNYSSVNDRSDLVDFYYGNKVY